MLGYSTELLVSKALSSLVHIMQFFLIPLATEQNTDTDYTYVLQSKTGQTKNWLAQVRMQPLPGHYGQFFVLTVLLRALEHQ